MPAHKKKKELALARKLSFSTRRKKKGIETKRQDPTNFTEPDHS